MSYEAVIGLEIHAQLLTATKIFCGCPTAFGAAPNAHTCPVCVGLPGALPVLNARAVELAARPDEKVGAPAVRYLNRLSDLLFVAARYVNGRGKRDILWVPGANR